MKRFWTDVAIGRSAGGYGVELDAKPIRLPGGAVLAIPQRGLAEAIADEWRQAAPSIGDLVRPDDLPLTRLAGTAIERIAPDAGSVIPILLDYARADLLCYRVCEPETLRDAQALYWQPWLDWAAREVNIHLNSTTKLIAIDQPEASIEAARTILEDFDTWSLAALGVLIPALGSLVLGLAVVRGELDPEAAHELANLEARFQAEAWGQDKEAQARLDQIAKDIATAARFATLTRS